MQERTKNIVSGLFLLVFSTAVFIAARQIEARLPIGVDSGFFPEITSAVLGILAIIILVQGVKKPRSGEAPQKLERHGVMAVTATLVLLAVYGFAIPHVGFLSATIVFLIAQFFILSPEGKARPVAFIAISAVTSVIVYFIFTSGFGLILPAGRVW